MFTGLPSHPMDIFDHKTKITCSYEPVICSQIQISIANINRILNVAKKAISVGQEYDTKIGYYHKRNPIVQI